jgi:hypothetical protein
MSSGLKTGADLLICELQDALAAATEIRDQAAYAQRTGDMDGEHREIVEHQAQHLAHALSSVTGAANWVADEIRGLSA